ncbi:MAG: hypothetical protein ACXWX5_06130 [Actinomycetota bacterium]
MTKKLLISTAMSAVVGACTMTAQPGRSTTPAVSPAIASPSVDAGAPSSIALPWLPPQGVVVERNGGVAFVALDGRVLAKLHGFELANPTEAPGPILLRKDHAWFELEATLHQLRPIGHARADALRTLDDPAIDLPVPPEMMVHGVPAGHWRFALLSPDGDRILSQWSGECEVPTAYVSSLQAGQPVPITGPSMIAADIPESFALGWTHGDRMLVLLFGGVCGSGSAVPGIYTFNTSGGSTLITTVPSVGPQLARMWGSR